MNGMSGRLLRQKCGFVNIVKRGGKYLCSVCAKEMPEYWEAFVVADGLKLPEETAERVRPLR